jgi:hypothetical protein
LRRNNQEAKQRSAERRLREDEAPRLINEVRRLTSLQIDVTNGGSQYLWRIVVERAPALFEIACPEPACTNGGHDITRSVMHALRTSSQRFEGEGVCHGDVPLGSCGRVLKYVAQATYRDA